MKSEDITKITLQIGDKKVSWTSDAWDHNADDLIDAFAGLMIAHTFLPITVYTSLKERGEDMLNYGLTATECREEIEELEKEVKSLRDQVEAYRNRDKEQRADSEPDTEPSYCAEGYLTYRTGYDPAAMPPEPEKECEQIKESKIPELDCTGICDICAFYGRMCESVDESEYPATVEECEQAEESKVPGPGTEPKTECIGRCEETGECRIVDLP